VQNKKVGVGVRSRADRPLSNGALWSIRTALSVEPKGTIGWKLTYDYYALPAAAR
jgi:hypothetical protein